MLTKACVRGCGTRTKGKCYLCSGQSPNGMSVEFFIKDPPIYWPYPFSRAPKILPRNPRKVDSIKDVYMWVSDKDYSSPWFYIEETRNFGMSRKVSSNFPFEQLTPGQSKIHLIFRKGIPKFYYDCVSWEEDKWWQSVCKIYKNNSYLWDENTTPGHHPTYDVPDETNPKTMTMEQLTFNFCTFAHRELSVWMTNNIKLVDGKIYNRCEIFFPTMNNPSFSYFTGEGFVGLNESLDDKKKMVTNTKNWYPAILLSFPINHVEFPFEENKKAKVAASKAGYQTFVTDY